MTNLTSSQLYLRLLHYVAPYWQAFAVSVLTLIVVAVTEAALPALMKPLLDGTFVERDPVLIRLVPALIILLFLVRGVATFAGSYTSNWVGNKVVMDLRNEMFRKLLHLPNPYYADHPTGTLISKLTFDVIQVTTAATSVVTVAVKDSLTIIGLLGWMFYLNWKLTLIGLVIAPPIVYIVQVVSLRLRKMSRETQRAMGELNQVVEEAIEGQKVVKIFGGQDYEAKRFHETNNWVRRYTMKQVSAAAANVPIVQLLAAVAIASIIYLVTAQSATDKTTVGSFVSFIAALLMLTAPLKRLTGVNEYLQRGLAAAESVFELLDQQAEKDQGQVELQRAKGEIRFEGLSFSYGDPSRLALRDINLTIHPGETVALVGASGSGKTTLANLVPRFYHPTRGRILLDGHDLEELKLASLRANIALVSQDVVLFNDTVAANIAYGAMSKVSEAKIIAAGEAAHAMEFIRELPQGLNTLVGENGVKLSGGQRQRLAIARAMLKNAPVLILDEATSALDTESERHVQAALEALMQGRTTVVIAHRLSTIEHADRIVVLANGGIAEIGTHQGLLARSGVYARLYQIQFAPARNAQ
ncbi:MAG TPA: lipid A export permease/ATP-binding protein MsbA [Burkholderiales bacterium]|nr:lipid A export permease/ATP-binding protein MsbA [Burkholderiales bacterium]